MGKLVIAGGTGFLGQALVAYFKKTFAEIVILTRGKSQQIDKVTYCHWDAKTMNTWAHHLDNSDVLINMVGRSVDCRYNEKNKALILNSRVDATLILGKAVSKAKNPPKVWLNSSTATIYRHSIDKEMDEFSGEIGSGFSVEVARAWEGAFFGIKTPYTRKVALRTSIVLGQNGGALGPIKNIVRMGFGGKQGPGNQKFSWIHITDFVRSIEFIIATNDLEGPINLVAPKPTTNAALMTMVRKSIGSAFALPLPKIVLELGARIIQTETELLLKSRNVIPVKLLNAGFEFRFSLLENALKNLG